MSIDPADAPSVELTLADELHDLGMWNDWRLTHEREVRQQLPATPAVSDEQLTEHELVPIDLPTCQQAIECGRVG